MLDFYYYLGFIYLFIQSHRIYDIITFKDTTKEEIEDLEQKQKEMFSKTDSQIIWGLIFTVIKALALIIIEASKLIFCWWWMIFGIKHSEISKLFIALISVDILYLIFMSYVLIAIIFNVGVRNLFDFMKSGELSKSKQKFEKGFNLYFTSCKIILSITILYFHFSGYGF